MKFSNKCVVITGSGSGIGRATALCFAKEGADVVVADINLDAAMETVGQIQKLNGKAVAFKADVSDPASVQDLVAFTIKTFSGVHAIVNNAAIQINKTAEDTSFEEWSKQLAINLAGVFLCSNYFLPHFKKSKGRILNLSSLNRFFVTPTCPPYYPP